MTYQGGQIDDERYMAARRDTDAAGARKAAAELDLEVAKIRLAKAREGADWRERTCGECGYAVSSEKDFFMCVPPRCRKFNIEVGKFDSGGDYTAISACPDFIPKEKP